MTCAIFDDLPLSDRKPCAKPMRPNVVMHLANYVGQLLESWTPTVVHIITRREGPQATVDLRRCFVNIILRSKGRQRSIINSSIFSFILIII